MLAKLLLKTEERIEVTGRRGKRRKQLLDDVKEKRGYWKLKAEAADRTVCRNLSGRDCGPALIALSQTISVSVQRQEERTMCLKMAARKVNRRLCPDLNPGLPEYEEGCQ